MYNNIKLNTILAVVYKIVIRLIIILHITGFYIYWSSYQYIQFLQDHLDNIWESTLLTTIIL